MRTRTLLVTAALTALPVLAAAQDSDNMITYKGLALGATKDEFAARFPDWSCRETYCRFSWDACWNDAYRKKLDTSGCHERNSLGGAGIESATASFRDDKLQSIFFSLKSENVDRLIKAVSARYGAPTRVDDEPFVTRAGVSHANVLATWEQPGLWFSSRRHSGSLGSGYASLKTSEQLARDLEELKARKAKDKSDF
jgi:hypothetical protein